ncbi:MAG: hypothetical protein CMO34_07650 [Verrucomicrobia bacterium]|nr:hypothetical protein [Verrucomicrobiota bacterium]
MVAFLGFAFDFFIRGDQFMGIVLVFNGIINIIAYQQAPRRVATITVLLNVFNALLSQTVAYNYSEIDYPYLYVLWQSLTFAFIIAVIRQLYSIVLNKKYRSKQKKRIS